MKSVLQFHLLALALCVGCTTLETAEETDTPARAEKLHRRGVHHFKAGKLDKAGLAFHNALLVDEEFGPAHNNMGLLYYQKGDLYSAAWSFERAMNSMPERPEPMNNLGMTLDAAGRLDEAIELYQSAWALEPSNPEFLGNLVSAKLRRGDRDFSVFEELQELIFVETRPDWRVFAQQQLVMLTRYTERGPVEVSTSDESDESTPEELPPEFLPSPPPVMLLNPADE